MLRKFLVALVVATISFIILSIIFGNVPFLAPYSWSVIVLSLLFGVIAFYSTPASRTIV